MARRHRARAWPAHTHGVTSHKARLRRSGDHAKLSAAGPRKRAQPAAPHQRNVPSREISCGPARTHPWDDERKRRVRTVHLEWRPLERSQRSARVNGAQPVAQTGHDRPLGQSAKVWPALTGEVTSLGPQKYMRGRRGDGLGKGGGKRAERGKKRNNEGIGRCIAHVR